MHCLVTGGAGFFGTHLIRRLLEAGITVRALDLLPLPDPDFSPHVEVIEGDVRDPTAVGRAVAGVDLIYHAAALVPITRAGRMFRAVNVEGTRQVLEAARRAGVGHVVHISSSAVYGIPKRVPVDEDAPYNPLGAYERSKVEAERLCEAYRARGLTVTILRPSTIVGPGRLGILEVLFEWIHRGRPVYILGSGSNSYQLVSTRDFAEVCLLVGARGTGDDFNIGAADFGTLREDLEALIRHAGTASHVVSVPPIFVRYGLQILDWLRLSPFVQWHYRTIDRNFYVDTAKARRVLSWKPKDSNVAILCQAYDWFIKLTWGVESNKAGKPQRLLQLRGPAQVGSRR